MRTAPVEATHLVKTRRAGRTAIETAADAGAVAEVVEAASSIPRREANLAPPGHRAFVIKPVTAKPPTPQEAAPTTTPVQPTHAPAVVPRNPLAAPPETKGVAGAVQGIIRLLRFKKK